MGNRSYHRCDRPAPAELAIACVAKRKLALAPAECRIVADPLVSCSYLQMAKAIARSIGRWRVLDAYSGNGGVATALGGEACGHVSAPPGQEPGWWLRGSFPMGTGRWRICGPGARTAELGRLSSATLAR